MEKSQPREPAFKPVLFNNLFMWKQQLVFMGFCIAFPIVVGLIVYHKEKRK